MPFLDPLGEPPPDVVWDDRADERDGGACKISEFMPRARIRPKKHRNFF